MAFCTSLRRRPSFASAIPALTSNNFLRENNLGTHDISLPFERMTTGSTSLRSTRFLLFSRHALEDHAIPDTISRVRRFVAITGGPDLAIVMLLADAKTSSNGLDCSSEIDGYSRLQAELFAHHDLPSIPTLPLATLGNLPALLQKYRDTALRARSLHNDYKKPSPFKILRQCTMSPPVDETVAYFITDIFVDLRELAMACAKASRDDLPSIDSFEASPYFSSGSSHDVAHSVDTMLDSKIRKLKAFNAVAARDIIRFWQTPSMRAPTS